MYSENPAGVDPYTYAITATQRCGNYVAEGDCYNREHIIPQSILIQHHQWFLMLILSSTDGKVKSVHNYPHSVVVTPTETTRNGWNWELVLRQLYRARF
jgi:hypothetical protein